MREPLAKKGTGTIIFFLAAAAAVLAYLLIASDKPEKIEDTKSVNPVLKLSFAKMPASGDGHFELWSRNPNGGEQSLGYFRVLEGGSMVNLAGEPFLGLPLTEIPPTASELLITLEKGQEPVPERSGRVLLLGKLDETKAEMKTVLPSFGEKNEAILSRENLINVKSALKFSDDQKGFKIGQWIIKEAENYRLGAENQQNKPSELNDGKTKVIISLEPDFRRTNELDFPFLPVLQGRIPYNHTYDKGFSLEFVGREELPSGVAEIEKR